MDRMSFFCVLAAFWLGCVGSVFGGSAAGGGGRFRSGAVVEDVRARSGGGRSGMLERFFGGVESGLEDNRDIFGDGYSFFDSGYAGGDVVLYRGEWEGLRSAREDAFGRLALRVAGDVARETPVGAGVERFVRGVSRWSRVGCEESGVVLPGEEGVGSSDYGVLVGVNGYTSLDSVGNDWAFRLRGHYGGVEAEASYSPVTGRGKVDLSCGGFNVSAESEDGEERVRFVYEGKF